MSRRDGVEQADRGSPTIWVGESMTETYDAAIVGSGASGGWVAKQLTEAGLRVAVLEAGRKLDPAVDYTDHRPPYEMPLRGALRASRARRATDPAKGVRRLHEPSVREGHRMPLHHAEGPAVRVVSRPPRGRQVDHVGTPDLPALRLRLQGRVPRRVRRRLAARLRRARSLLRPGGALHRGVGASRRAAPASGRPVPAAHANDLRRGRDAPGGRGQVRPHPDHRPLRDSDRSPARSAPLPLLRAL